MTLPVKLRSAKLWDSSKLQTERLDKTVWTCWGVKGRKSLNVSPQVGGTGSSTPPPQCSTGLTSNTKLVHLPKLLNRFKSKFGGHKGSLSILGGTCPPCIPFPAQIYINDNYICRNFFLSALSQMTFKTCIYYMYYLPGTGSLFKTTCAVTIYVRSKRSHVYCMCMILSDWSS